MNCEVDNAPTEPRIKSPLKNSIMKRPTLYKIKYSAATSPSAFFLFAKNSNTKNNSKSKALENNCVGITETPAGAKEFAGNITPIGLVVTLP